MQRILKNAPYVKELRDPTCKFLQ